MRILGVHNYYGSSAPSGENVVFDAEMELLRSRGHDVAVFCRHSDEIRGKGALGTLRGALATPWNPASAAALRREVARFRPDVVHAHNTFPLISPAVFHAVGKGVARVLTLHNYRLFCPGAVPLREGVVCTECLDRRSSLPSLRHGCYRGSRIATVPLALSTALHRFAGTWSRHVEAFVTLTEFQRGLLVRAGLPAGRVHVKHNFFAGTPEVKPWGARAAHVVFAGRLSVEKGVEHLVRAWLSWGSSAPELRILGDGPLAAPLQRLAQSRPEVRIRFLGQRSASEAEEEIAGACLLVLPSICFEGFPMVIREAFAFATPVAVSDAGPLPAIVAEGRSGVIFKAGDAASLMERVREAWHTPGLLERLAGGARAEFLARYTEEGNLQTLMEIYQAALARRAD